MFEQRLILNRYRIIGRAGAGGYATVQHAFDTRLKRDVAIKCIPLSNTQALNAKAASNSPSDSYDDYSDYNYDGYEDGYIDEYELPAEPGFLKKKEDREARRAHARRQGGRYRNDSIALRSNYSRSLSTVSAAKPFKTSSNSYAVNTQDIAKLAGQLPGVISGAGHTKISGIDDAAVIDADMIEDGDASAPTTPKRTAAVSGPSSEAATSRTSKKQLRDPDFIRMHARAAARAADGFSDLNHGKAAPGASVADEDHIPGLEEARTAAHLNDANIVTVYDCVVEGQMAYVIMEYVEGKTLARVMHELENDITLDMITSVFTSVAHALQVAHKAGVLHLDIKPENVVINKDGVVKVTDFGLSTLMDASGQGTTGGGTIGYMPLEQMRQQPLDVRTDEWALASLTYEMLSGINPFRARTLEGAAQAIETAELILPSVCWDVEPEIDDVMFIALDPDQDRRYENVSDFSNDLTPFLGDAKDGKKQLADVVTNGVGEDDLAARQMAQEDAAQAAPKGLLASLLGRAQAESVQPSPSSHKGASAQSSKKAPSQASNSQSLEDEDQGAYKVLFVDKLGDKGMSIVMRIAAALSSCMMGVIALMNFRFNFTGASQGANSGASTQTATGSSQAATSDGGSGGLDISGVISDPGNAAANAASNVAQNLSDGFTSTYSTAYGDASVFGLFSMAPIVAWVLLIAFMAASIVRPRIGMPVSYVAFFIMLVFNQAWTSAFLLLLATGVWWWFFGRRSDLDCTIVMMQPLFGSIGLGAVVPVLAGAFLDVKQAVCATAMGCISALVFASLGSGDVMNWEVYSNFIVAINPAIAGPSIMAGLVGTFANPNTWCVLVSWLVAATLFSLLCLKGTRSFDILGSAVCAAVLLLGIVFMPLVVGQQVEVGALTIVGCLGPALLGVALSLMSVTDRVRTDYEG